MRPNASRNVEPRSIAEPVAPPTSTAPDSVTSVTPSQACCCPALPAVTVVLPPTASRTEAVDLHLCMHHYRASEAALAAAHAAVSFVDR